MRPLLKKSIFLIILLILSLSCQIFGGETEQIPQSPRVVLQRLSVVFLGQDSHKIIGSGFPGTDGKGVIENYHLIVGNVDTGKKVQRILVAGNTSTLTWELPCNND